MGVPLQSEHLQNYFPITITQYPYFNPFVPNAPFLYPLKTSENLKVFWCFQGVEKGCIGNKWVNFFLKIAPPKSRRLPWGNWSQKYLKLKFSDRVKVSRFEIFETIFKIFQKQPIEMQNIEFLYAQWLTLGYHTRHQFLFEMFPFPIPNLDFSYRSCISFNMD